MSQRKIYALLIVAALVIVLALAYATYHSLTPSAEFWDHFWPHFWSELIVGVVIAAIISWTIAKSKIIEASMVANANETDAGGATHLINFAVRNTCNHCLSNDGIYWHIFVERNCYIDIKAKELSTVQFQADREIEGKNFLHISGLLSAPIFPKRYVEIA